MVREDLLNHRNHIVQKTTETMENANCVQCPALVAIWEAQTIEVEMVQNLHFPLIDDRYQAIPEAHRQTFRWIFGAILQIGSGQEMACIGLMAKLVVANRH
jgi:hypothetical protein